MSDTKLFRNCVSLAVLRG